MQTPEVQKILKWGWIVGIVLTIYLAALALGALKDFGGPRPDYNSISITGHGEAISVPNIATFSFSVSEDGNVVNTVQEQVTKKMDAILAQLKDLGIEEKDIKTTEYSVYPKYTYETAVCSKSYCPPGRQVPDGYTVTHGVTVKVRKTDDAGKALSVVGENGGDNISGLTFAVDEPEKIMDEARAAAILDAKERAKAVADELDVRLIRVVSYYDNTDGGPIPYYAEGRGGDMAVKQSAPAPTLPAGENKVTINVTVTYEIR